MPLKQTTQQQTDAMNFYADILNEISDRIEIVNRAINGGFGLPPPFIREISFLQLRMICELMAIGCLVAHGDIEGTKSRSLQTEYAADKIINRMQHLHSNFFPHPVSMKKDGNATHLDKIEAGYLTKPEMIRLYHKCGDKLHRGRLGSFLETSTEMKAADFSDILGWGRKIISLLESHLISSRDNLSHFICALKYADTNNRACVAIAQSPLPE